MMHERRKYTRYKTDLEITYIYRRGMIAFEGAAEIKNISLGGMKLKVPSAIKKGEIFLAEIELPVNQTISAIVSTVWGKPDIDNKHTELGIKFDWVSNINKLAGYIESLQKKAA